VTPTVIGRGANGDRRVLSLPCEIRITQAAVIPSLSYQSYRSILGVS